MIAVDLQGAKEKILNIRSFALTTCMQRTSVLRCWMGCSGTDSLLRVSWAIESMAELRDGVIPSAGSSKNAASAASACDELVVCRKHPQVRIQQERPAQRMSLLHFRCKERRRTQRVSLAVPLIVHGQTEDGRKFAIHVKSNAVSQHGAQLETEYPVVVGQVLLLLNENNARKVESRVVSIQRKRDGKTYVGVEFLSGEINFWNMTFPLPGAKPLRRAIPKVTPNKVTA